MAYHTLGNLKKREYSASNHSSTTAAAFAVANRCVLIEALCTVKVNQTATAGSWTASRNGTQITGLSSVAVTTGAVGESSAVTSASPTGGSSEYVWQRGDIISVVGSSLTAANWTFAVTEF